MLPFINKTVSTKKRRGCRHQTGARRHVFYVLQEIRSDFAALLSGIPLWPEWQAEYGVRPVWVFCCTLQGLRAAESLADSRGSNGIGSCCLSPFMLLYVHRNHEAYYGRAYGGGGRGRLYTYRYTVTTRMTPALRWAAMRVILMFH